MKVNGDFVSKEDKIKEHLDKNHGYISTSEILNLNISKPLIKKYVESGLLRKVSHGLYIDSNLLQDDEYIFQKRYPEAIFSYNTALYFLNLSNRAPHKIEITLSNKKRIACDYEVHYISDKYYDIGIIEIESIFGNPIKIYNAERSICDMLRNGDFELELQNAVLRNYFRSKNKDLDKLLEYAKIFKIYDKVNTLVEYEMG